MFFFSVLFGRLFVSGCFQIEMRDVKCNEKYSFSDLFYVFIHEVEGNGRENTNSSHRRERECMMLCELVCVCVLRA